MRSYKFKDYIEAFELPNHGDASIESILEKLTPHDIVEFALHVAEDVLKFAEDDEQDAKICIKSVKNWLQHPTEQNADLAYSVAYTAPYQEMSPALESAHYAASAAYTAQRGNAKFTAKEANSAAKSAAAAQYHASNENLQNVSKVYDKALAKYKSWASAYHVTPIGNVNKQEIAKLMDKEGNHLPFLLDYLEENGVKPSDFTLKQFGVKKFGNNKEIAQQIIESGMLSGFYRAISNVLSKIHLR